MIHGMNTWESMPTLLADVCMATKSACVCAVSGSGLQCFGISLIAIRGKRSVRVLPNLEAGIIVQ